MQTELPTLDRLGSVNADGSRRAIFPAEVRGRFIRARRVVFAVLLAVYVLAPVVKVGGHPALHLDVAARRFYLLGATFNAQDFWLVILLMTTAAFALIFATAAWGRVWCGWACPQTVFLEALYRPIERAFDGSPEKRAREARGPMTLRRAARAAAKHSAYVVVSLLLSHVALSLFVSVRELSGMVFEGPAKHPVAFGWTIGVTAVLYANFAWFREQFCVMVCPYGRLQSALHDKDSIVVAYDQRRGEPRGHLKSNLANLGACIDCRRCVAVCPTAIDIRNGMQMECIGCAQCIDACDEVMDKVGRPRGLIRYDSEPGFAGQQRRFFRPRILLYGALLLSSATAFAVTLARHAPFEANLLRSRGTAFVVEGDKVQNQFELHLVNKSPDEARYLLEVVAPENVQVVLPLAEIKLGSLEDVRVPLFLIANTGKHPLGFDFRVRIREGAAGEVNELTGRFLAGGSASSTGG